VDGFRSPRERYEAIAEEVLDYYLSATTPQGNLGSEDVDEEELTIPESVMWLERLETYGLLFPGSWSEQPHHFMNDIEWAKLGKMRYRNIRERERSREEAGGNTGVMNANELLRLANGGG